MLIYSSNGRAELTQSKNLRVRSNDIFPSIHSCLIYLSVSCWLMSGIFSNPILLNDPTTTQRCSTPPYYNLHFGNGTSSLHRQFRSYRRIYHRSILLLRHSPLTQTLPYEAKGESLPQSLLGWLSLLPLCNPVYEWHYPMYSTVGRSISVFCIGRFGATGEVV